MGVYSSTPGTPQVLSAVNFSTGTGNQLFVSPVGQAYSGPSQGNAGFYVLGPADTTVPSTLATAAYSATNKGTVMTYTVPLNDPNAETPDAANMQPTVMLQRLANPNLAYQPISTNPGYNPYVTVDYVDMTTVPGGTVNDARQYTAAGQINPVPDPSTRYSYGRKQPYGGSTLLKQQPNPANPMGTPQTTFYRDNADSTTPPNNNPNPPAGYPAFDWLVHLDRPVVSPAELLFVSAFKPHELTQQFVKNPTTGMFSHYAPWLDQNSRLYRLLEFVKMKNPTPGFVNGGRIPGRVNINTIDSSAVEVFRALCDAEPGNTFYSGTGDDHGGPGVGRPVAAAHAGGAGANDRPFWGMATGFDPGSTQYPAGTGIIQTLLAPSTNPAVPGSASWR